MPTLRGEIGWCQLFSEPGAGSDLAALSSTRATRVEGGWVLNGQKVWTSMAKEADWGICLARTNPDAAKHDGISCFMVDMKTPGIDIRPLRELTGMAMFNEVFFDDVFVPEDCLVGREHDGWRVRPDDPRQRARLHGVEQHDRRRGRRRAEGDRGARARRRPPRARRGRRARRHRPRARARSGSGSRWPRCAGADPSGSEAAVRKLLGVQHDQHVQEVGMTLAGPEAQPRPTATPRRGRRRSCSTAA